MPLLQIVTICTIHCTLIAVSLSGVVAPVYPWPAVSVCLVSSAHASSAPVWFIDSASHYLMGTGDHTTFVQTGIVLYSTVSSQKYILLVQYITSSLGMTSYSIKSNVHLSLHKCVTLVASICWAPLQVPACRASTLSHDSCRASLPAYYGILQLYLSKPIAVISYF